MINDSYNILECHHKCKQNLAIYISGPLGNIVNIYCTVDAMSMSLMFGMWESLSLSQYQHSNVLLQTNFGEFDCSVNLVKCKL